MLTHAASIPRHSIVVVSAGEIDLRENGVIADAGRGKAAQKYTSRQEAINTTAGVFCAGLRELQAAGDHRCIVVLPVRPVPPSSSGDLADSAKLVTAWNSRIATLLEGSQRIVHLGCFKDMKDERTGLLRYVALAKQALTASI